ncbi:UDP-3-O-(3-hydroxymyristoyl)glucosamine N-acyltransferase [Bermanella marisrubri]|uniref:UDP-3-O-acylglucosamine N-acyltransferase n=1 Tax=Bermanella marisrubri TaxID=207949 RepID=Q1N1W4_9GAMM|nr:UDP-3-O-(3-hydroxymyristoyl)glucosamine N-acyltransferase [Bermanella marisrubri]EAT12167.1 UDP-3-O-[3-hydroxymyristoyl] glucosamine N-acyltransferase [Oceanobacter sp. RED65] [Bermanella marisrubri]QIZ83643.1 UDP-3-O-(3-hydroxymyristoyl)glucosamine N-acyltransferase [Bermanella marisrubri]
MPKLQTIAEHIGARVEGDASSSVDGLATLLDAGPTELSFLANMAYRDQLQITQAGAVIVHPKQAHEVKGTALVMDNPYLGYAKASQLFNTLPDAQKGIHSSAVIHESAQVDTTASIGANAVVEANAVIAKNAVIGSGSFIGNNSRIGEGTRLHSNVSVYHDVIIGTDCIIHSGAVIGSDGFGFAPDRGAWVKIAQIGGVVIGDHVEIGANSTIDRGAMSDTQIHDGVKLDNQIQIAHNVVVGEATAMAGGCLIAGSTQIGKGCTIAGGVGIAGHLKIADGVHVTAMTLVTNHISEAGSYSSGTAMSNTSEWRKSAARFRQLDSIAKRLKQCERVLSEKE